MDSFLSFWKERNSRPGFYGMATVAGIKVTVHKGVYSPDASCTHATTMLVRVVKDLSGKSVLDLGTGTGILAIYAAEQGAARCTASDIQPEAVANAKENVSAHGLDGKIEVIQSDLFGSITGKYDVILANLPIMDPEWKELNQYSIEVNRRFFAQLDDFLEDNGVAYVSATSWGDLESLRTMISESKFSSREHTEEARDATWYVFELTRKVDRG